MPRLVRFILGTFILVLLVGVPYVYAWHYRNQVRNLRVVKDGILFRSGQLSLAGLKRVTRDFEIKTVISFRDAETPGGLPPDWKEEEFCRTQEIAFFRIPPGSWWTKEGPPPAQDGVRKFREIMDNPDNYPVLMHCWRGVHRTGAFCAIYRMEYEHWSNQEALAELYQAGYTNLFDEFDILGFLGNFRPRWQGEQNKEQGAGSKEPTARTEE